MILFLPIFFLVIYFFLPTFRNDLVVLTPKNGMLFIWFNKLVLIPIEIVLVGNKMVIFEGNSTQIYTEISIILTSFIGFVVGWQMNRLQIGNSQVGIANADQRNQNRLQIGKIGRAHV